MKTVEIKGIKVNARHGVLEKEKVAPQNFIIDISFCYDAGKAAESDDIADAVNYAEVCGVAYNICANNSFNLIEKLAYEIAFSIIGRFDPIQNISVTVHKPQAPVDIPFEDISVCASIERVKTVLSLGSNLGDRKEMLDGAVSALAKVRGIKILKVSDYIATKPYGGVADGEFLNCACLAECLLPPRGLLEAVHGIENDFGRVRGERWGDRTLDIDIIFFGDKIITEEGLSIPHPDYFNRDFVLVPLKQIVPGFVCPVSRLRVSDMPPASVSPKIGK